MPPTYRPFSSGAGFAFRAAPLQQLVREPMDAQVVDLFPDDEVTESDDRITTAEHELRLAARAAEVEITVRRELSDHIRELEGMVPSLSPVMEALASARRRVLQDAAREVAELAIDMARRVVGQTLAIRADAIMPLVERALEPVQHDEIVRIRVDESRGEAVRAALPDTLRDRVLSEPGLGDRVIVETDGARITACADAAMDGLAAALRDHGVDVG